MNQKSKATAAILAFFLGCWGIHCFYVGQKTKGVIMLILGIIGCFTFVPWIITGIIALIDLIKYLTMSDVAFQAFCDGNSNGGHKQSVYYSNTQDMQDVYEENSNNEDSAFCTECGSKIVKGTKFCPVCGSKQ